MKYYQYISHSVVDDGYIDFERFQNALGFTNSAVAARIFEALDDTGEHVLGFNQFIRAFSILSPKENEEEKIKCKTNKNKFNEKKSTTHFQNR